MFNKNTTSEYIDFLTDEMIVMIWRCRNWPEEHYAMVVLIFIYLFAYSRANKITIEMLMNSCL